MPSISQVAAATAAIMAGSTSSAVDVPSKDHYNATATATMAVNEWVIYQSFDWLSLNNRGDVYNLISSQASALAGVGINAIWFPPPSQSVDVQGYLPQQWYSLVYESNLKSAISTINGKGMVALADVVVNHRTAPYVDSCTGHYTSFANPAMGNWAVTRDDENCAGKADACGCGNYDTGDVVTYAPDLDHTNSGVQQGVKDYLNFLKGYNFGGWRLDMVKGYSASYAGSYISSSAPQFSVGEYWDSSTNNVSLSKFYFVCFLWAYIINDLTVSFLFQVNNWVLGTGSKSNAFDFPLRYVLQSAIRNNNYASLGWTLPGLIGANPSHSVTFLDNHDTSRDDRFGSTDQITMGTHTSSRTPAPPACTTRTGRRPLSMPPSRA